MAPHGISLLEGIDFRAHFNPDSTGYSVLPFQFLVSPVFHGFYSIRISRRVNRVNRVFWGRELLYSHGIVNVGRACIRAVMIFKAGEYALLRAWPERSRKGEPRTGPGPQGLFRNNMYNYRSF
jgi:hypothetical protein